MSLVFNKFEGWFYEFCPDTQRSERFADALYSYKQGNVDYWDVVEWLRSAYEEGYNQARYDTLKLYWDDGK